MARSFPIWTLRVAVGVIAVLSVVWVVASWFHANAIRSEFLIPASHVDGPEFEALSVDAGRVVLPRAPETVREGVWGMRAADAYAQVSTIVRITPDNVERGVRMLDGEVATGDLVRMDIDAFTGDPLTSHSIGFEDLVIPADIGPHPGWFVDGRRSTWILFVHGRGDERLAESLRIIPSLVEAGYPIMVMAYRNDVGATASDGGMRLWGLEEWMDVDAAIALGQRRGARDFVVVGSGFGASVVSMFLHESDQIAAVRGVIYDSPVIDFEDVVRKWSGDAGTPRPVGWLGRRLATVRFGVDWRDLDQTRRVDEFDVPMLIMVGGEDTVSDPDATRVFADAMGDQVAFTRFEQGGHTDLWNIDQNRYEATVRNWLLDLIGTE